MGKCLLRERKKERRRKMWESGLELDEKPWNANLLKGKILV